jgi:hypothetical protein
MKFSPPNQVTFIPTSVFDLRPSTFDPRPCYGDPMQEMEPTVFVSFMKIVACICMCAMLVAVWPGDGDE